ncbi:MAG: hypothetical protein OEY58_14930 [Gammaproteobacteria bacterium]|nr:hypothetical protein [Gammaproteobacteria bacterium]
MNPFRLCLLALVLVFGAPACVVDPIPRPPLPHELHDYHFYPSVGVYFDVVTGYYHYRRGNVWVQVDVLPPGFVLNSHDRVILQLGPHPHKRYGEHHKKYRSKRYDKDHDADRREREENNRRHKEHKHRR